MFVKRALSAAEEKKAADTLNQDRVHTFRRMIVRAGRIGISGHERPDGDCIGSCLGLFNYIKDNYPDKQVEVNLQPIPDKFLFLKNSDRICSETREIPPYDLYIALDCSEPERLGEFYGYFEQAGETICIDHHFTNEGFGDLAFIEPEASSTCEILVGLMEESRISQACAEALYTGIVHDTGVFKHTNTSRRTLEMAGLLLDKGVNTEMIIDETFFKKTYLQNQILGRALIESILLLDGRMIFSVISRKDMDFYGIDSADLDGIIDQLRVTEKVECALLMHEIERGTYKVSMRSKDKVDVSEIALSFGGGGHKKAAGCTMYGAKRDIIMNIAEQVELQLSGKDEEP